jgi:hypothetical protein
MTTNAPSLVLVASHAPCLSTYAVEVLSESDRPSAAGTGGRLSAALLRKGVYGPRTLGLTKVGER